MFTAHCISYSVFKSWPDYLNLVTISRPPADYSMGKKQANKIIGKLALKNINDMDVVIL